MQTLRHFYLLLLLGMVACQHKDTAFTAPVYDLIVEGGINSLTPQQYIRLSKPAGISAPSVQPVNGAMVRVNDGPTDITFTEIGHSGIYTAVMKNNKNYGEAYTLHVDYNGKQYEATDTMTAVVPIRASYIPLTQQRDTGFTIMIPKHIFGVSYPQEWLIMPKKNRWDPAQFKAVYNYSYSHIYGTPNALNPLIQQKSILHTSATDSLVIYKFSLSFNYSTFLYNLFQETDWKGLLSPTPSNVKGNISGNANGYFYAIDVDLQTMAVKDINK